MNNEENHVVYETALLEYAHAWLVIWNKLPI